MKSVFFKGAVAGLQSTVPKPQNNSLDSLAQGLGQDMYDWARTEPPSAVPTPFKLPVIPPTPDPPSQPTRVAPAVNPPSNMAWSTGQSPMRQSADYLPDAARKDPAQLPGSATASTLMADNTAEFKGIGQAATPTPKVYPKGWGERSVNFGNLSFAPALAQVAGPMAAPLAAHMMGLMAPQGPDTYIASGKSMATTAPEGFYDDELKVNVPTYSRPTSPGNALADMIQSVNPLTGGSYRYADPSVRNKLDQAWTNVFQPEHNRVFAEERDKLREQYPRYLTRTMADWIHNRANYLANQAASTKARHAVPRYPNDFELARPGEVTPDIAQEQDPAMVGATYGTPDGFGWQVSQGKASVVPGSRRPTEMQIPEGTIREHDRLALFRTPEGFGFKSQGYYEPTVAGRLRNAWGTAGDMVASGYNKGKELVSNAYNSGKELLSDAYDTAREKLPGVVDQAQQAVAPYMQDPRKGWGDNIGGAVDNIGNAANLVHDTVGAFRNFKNMVMNEGFPDQQTATRYGRQVEHSAQQLEAHLGGPEGKGQHLASLARQGALLGVNDKDAMLRMLAAARDYALPVDPVTGTPDPARRNRIGFNAVRQLKEMLERSDDPTFDVAVHNAIPNIDKIKTGSAQPSTLSPAMLKVARKILG